MTFELKKKDCKNVAIKFYTLIEFVLIVKILAIIYETFKKSYGFKRVVYLTRNNELDFLQQIKKIFQFKLHKHYLDFILLL